MNELELALDFPDNDVLECYLENTDTDQIRADIRDLLNRSGDRAAFKKKIIDLINAA